MENSEWQLHLLPQLRNEMAELGLLSPLLWVPIASAPDVCYDKLIDMLYFAPSDWDALMGSLTTLARNVFMGKLTYGSAVKSLQACRDFFADSPDPLIRRYWHALKHLVDCTWVLLTCLHRGRSALAVIPGVLGGLVSTRDLSQMQQSALAASKSVTLQLCHYAQWPSLMDERGPLFRGAVEAAGMALKLHPAEGVWITLYARCLSWRHPDKAVLLHGAARLSHTPFTVVELATLLAMSSNSRAVDLAAQLIAQAVAEWPDNIYVNTSYVTLLLTSNCRSLLSLQTAEECLRRARRLAPDSPLLSGYYWSLLDIQRAGGQLSPILEEGSQDEDVFGTWDEDKEKRLRSIAAKLYPGATVTATIKPHFLAEPAERRCERAKPLPVGNTRDDERDLVAPAKTLWSPTTSRRALRKSSSPPPQPPPESTTDSALSSPPSCRRLRTFVQVPKLRMPRSSSASSSSATSVAPTSATSVAPTSATSVAPSSATSVAPSSATSVAPSSATSVAPSSATSVAPSSATSVAPTSATSVAPTSASSALSVAPSSAVTPPHPLSLAARLYRVSVPPSPPSLKSRLPAPTHAVVPTTVVPPTPPPTPSPPREGSLRGETSLDGSNQDNSVPLWRRSSGATSVEKTSWREGPVAQMQRKWKAPSPCEFTLEEKKQPAVNCACSGACALLTYRYYGTVRPPHSAPKLCSLKIK
ncbi:hypothetical protein KUF71_024423 [Frankliniella fusca]|uniref:Uncharacterized protein n=1 Tax=Frankliniella fusca TaxID=407009 RepID=A0AAE1H5C2_9NEOP|nr:hypothetical protein KUF71_024423 [Frankliniella fusca]